MQNINIQISKDQSGKIQWLTDVLTNSVIPSNTILFKTLPGIGATYSELYKANRHSIIIEPNVPVIMGKRTNKKTGILGVCKGIYTDDIIYYLSNTDIKYKKILVTPESYHKVMNALEILEIDVYNKYFLLYDECDRTSKDIDYRESIIAPMENFFKFKHKAFVSATAIEPSDPTFKTQGFTKMTIKPQFDYSKELTLINTNNVFSSTKNLIEGINKKSDKETYCIFFNSINGIIAFAKHLGIAKSEYTIYCSTNKKSLLRENKYANVKDNIDGNFTKYNFFTSRFYSAVDIYMKELDGVTIIKPIVIMLTQLHIAEHTIIDPQSDAVQIIGRFRDGISKAYALTNLNKELKYREYEDATRFLNESEITYQRIRTLYNSTTTEGGKEVLRQALDLIPYSKFVMNDGSTNYYMRDNYFYKEKLKSLYTNLDKLKEAYNLEHFKLTTLEEKHVIDDSITSVRVPKLHYRNLVIAVCNELDAIKERKPAMLLYIDNTNELLSDLQRDFPDIVRAHHMLGTEDTIKAGTSSNALNRAIDVKYYSDAKGNFEFMKSLNLAFPIKTKKLWPEFKEEMQAVIDAHGLPLIPSEELLGEYFELSGRKIVKNGKKGFEILGHRFLN